MGRQIILKMLCHKDPEHLVTCYVNQHPAAGAVFYTVDGFHLIGSNPSFTGGQRERERERERERDRERVFF